MVAVLVLELPLGFTTVNVTDAPETATFELFFTVALIVTVLRTFTVVGNAVKEVIEMGVGGAVTVQFAVAVAGA